MNKKFDVNKSFDLFWREPLSILTEGLFKLVNIQSNIFGSKPSVNVDIVEKKSESVQKKLVFAKNRDFVNNFYK